VLRELHAQLARPLVRRYESGAFPQTTDDQGCEFRAGHLLSVCHGDLGQRRG
jgi:hypothetical protein